MLSPIGTHADDGPLMETPSLSATSTARPRPPLRAVGLMSGTSLDGIDAALVTTDGELVVARGPALTVPYPPAFRARLRGLLGRKPGPASQPVIAELTERHAAAVLALLDRAGLGLDAVDVIGFHGQTVWHRPDAGETIQIGDGEWLANRLGITVVSDFRSEDVRAGGQGAPLVPLFHAALAERLEKPLAILNIGGVANVTWLGPPGDGTSILAFDTGPGNALIDDWVAAHDAGAFDAGGRLASAGRTDEAALARWLGHPFFVAPPPKSLDRDAFAFATAELAGVALAEGAATLTAFTARAAAAGLAFMPAPPRRWLVCGGGRHNPVLVARIADAVAADVVPIEAIGCDGDFVEAEAFAFLAVRALRGLALTLPTTTGVAAPRTGGRIDAPASVAGRAPRREANRPTSG